MATSKANTGITDPSYRFQPGDLIEYRLPDEDTVYTGRIIIGYHMSKVHCDDGRIEWREGYGVDYDGTERRNGRPYFACPSRLRQRSDLAAARNDNAFQMMLSAVLTAPRRGRRPKSPYGTEAKAAK